MSMVLTDTNLRSFTKAVSWRLVGTLDTILLSFLITGKLTVALSIALSELVTKTILYYLHERMWNRVSWGRKVSGPTHTRSVVKSICWRTIGTIDTVLLAYYFSGTANEALSIGGVELLTKITLFYLHERVWAVIRWGRYVTSTVYNSKDKNTN